MSPTFERRLAMFTVETQSKRDEKYMKLTRKFADSRQVKFSSVNAIYFFIKLLSLKVDFYRNRVQCGMSCLVSRLQGWSGKWIMWNQLMLPVVNCNTGGGTDRKWKRILHCCTMDADISGSLGKKNSQDCVNAKREYMCTWQKESTIRDVEVSQIKKNINWLITLYVTTCALTEATERRQPFRYAKIAGKMLL